MDLWGASLLCTLECNIAFIPYMVLRTHTTPCTNQVLWDLVGRRCLPQIVAHRGHHLSVLAWSPDGGLLLTGAADCLLRVWRIAVPPPQQQHTTRSVKGASGSAAAAGGASSGLAPPPAALVELGGVAAATEGEEVGFFVADAAITSACFAGGCLKHSVSGCLRMRLSAAAGHGIGRGRPREQCVSVAAAVA